MVGSRVESPEYVDWLEELRKQGDLGFIAQTRDFPLNTLLTNHPRARTYQEVTDSVLNSRRVEDAIKEEAARTGAPLSKVRSDAEAIMTMMAHNWGAYSIRALGYTVVKVLDRIFDAIYVNADKLKQIRELCRSEAVVFMPTHRTYLDFLLVSIFCFQYEVPLPAIAAGMDFTNSWFMSEVLRRCGAFFIRRTIGKDRLYWAILSEYVQTHIVHYDRPVEFFVEGTRSRVGKSLHPKYGLLQIVLEPYLRGKVYDIVVVPVTTNYDKLLEEMLYSYELLGFPKPKETTAGLIKARDLLNKRFGRCFMTFGEPISVREYFGMTSLRSQIACQPDSQFLLSEMQRVQIKKFAHVVVKALDQNAVITVWSLACAAMAQRLTFGSYNVITYSQVLSAVMNLLKLLQSLGVVVHIAVSVDKDLRYYMDLHSNLFLPVDRTGADFELKLARFPVQLEGSVSRGIMEQAISHLVLATYSNSMMHSVCNVGYIAAIVLGMKLFNLTRLELQYRRLQKLLGREFIYVPEEESASFNEAVDNLTKAEIIETTDDSIRILKSEEFSALRNLILPYISNFQLVLESLLAMEVPDFSLNEIVAFTQMFVARLCESRSLSSSSIRLSFLSTEPIKNTCQILVSERVLTTMEGGRLRLDRSYANELLNGFSVITGSAFHLISAKL